MCSDSVVKCQEGDRRVDSLPRLGAETDDLEPSAVDLLCELVHCNVTGSTHQDQTAGGGGGVGLSKFYSALQSDSYTPPSPPSSSSDSRRSVDPCEVIDDGC